MKLIFFALLMILVLGCEYTECKRPYDYYEKCDCEPGICKPSIYKPKRD